MTIRRGSSIIAGVGPVDQTYSSNSTNAQSGIAVASAISGLTNTDLSNLTSQGKNIANWSSNVTNCITEIPQDIKLELNNGTLTLKAGSKVYMPNGFEADGTTPKFDVVVTESDLTWSNSDNRQFILSYDYTNNQLFGNWKENNLSGNSSNVPSNYFGYYYSVDDNLLYDYRGGIRDKKSSFPICNITSNTSQITSIDQVFNGFGYIGSTVFALPGVKGLIPNDRNADGSLKNIEFEVTSVKTGTIDANWLTQDWFIYPSEDITWYPLQAGEVNYDESKNLWLDTRIAGGVTFFCNFGHTTASGGKITSFTKKTAFHAVDRNDSSWLSGLGMPSSRYIDLTLGASGATYTAPANGWFCFYANSPSNHYAEIAIDDNARFGMRVEGFANEYVKVFVCCNKGQRIFLNYNSNGNDKAIRFHYAEGENV